MGMIVKDITHPGRHTSSLLEAICKLRAHAYTTAQGSSPDGSEDALFRQATYPFGKKKSRSWHCNA
eukprot:565941-Pyramimonas_sp.AAC.1